MILVATNLHHDLWGPSSWRLIHFSFLDVLPPYFIVGVFPHIPKVLPDDRLFEFVNEGPFVCFSWFDFELKGQVCEVWQDDGIWWEDQGGLLSCFADGSGWGVGLFEDVVTWGPWWGRNACGLWRFSQQVSRWFCKDAPPKILVLMIRRESRDGNLMHFLTLKTELYSTMLVSHLQL